MPADDRDAAYLLDMLDAAEEAQTYVQGKTLADYEAEPMLRAAVERKIESIGEAARKVSEGLKQQHAEIPWRKIIAQRNVIAHEYDLIRNAEIWEVATVHIPRLVAALEPLLPPVPSAPEEGGLAGQVSGST
jgi:uncharacterized protein with HEPN domain